MSDLSDTPHPHDQSDLGARVVVTTKTIADFWGVLLALGVVSVVLGLVLAFWPGETVKVVALLVALNLIVWGCGQLLLSFAPSSLHSGSRLVGALAGLFAVVVGVLFLFDPTRTVGAVCTLVGIVLIVAGVADVVQCWITGPIERIWGIVGGLVLIVAGIFLWVRPAQSLTFLVVLTCVWLIGYGLVTVIAALRLRKASLEKAAQV
ncbi:HdeD family acid-resistance protein [Marmoricola sp. RAF53]|uniref:HdeD family acid-resistance protein n=1 Tax=Marmoricola sp. RAF53 TaxID=3233059 RepID=UPI003F9CEE92